MSRKPRLNPAQGSFIQDSHIPEHDPTFEVREYIPDICDTDYKPEIPTVYGPEGSYMSVRKRALYLDVARVAIGLSNRATGFEIASNTREHAGGIYNRYQWRTEDIKRRVRENGQDHANDVRVNFWRATGYAGLRELVRKQPETSGLGDLITPAGVNARAKQEWRSFLNMYAVPSNKHSANARRRLKRRMEKTLEWTGKVIAE